MMGGITYEQIRYFVFAHPLYAESLNNLFMAIGRLVRSCIYDKSSASQQTLWQGKGRG